MRRTMRHEGLHALAVLGWLSTVGSLVGTASRLEADDGFFTDINNDIGEGINSPEVEWQPRVSADGRFLVFSSNRDGDYDIYLATRDDESEKFGGVRRLSEDVNSAFDEFNGFITADGLTLYFTRPLVADGPDDIWTATRTDLEGSFGNVTNLESVNTSSGDFAPCLSEDELTLLFN